MSAYDVMPDGEHLLTVVMSEPPPSPATRMNIVLYWRERQILQWPRSGKMPVIAAAELEPSELHSPPSKR